MAQAVISNCKRVFLWQSALWSLCDESVLGFFSPPWLLYLRCASALPTSQDETCTLFQLLLWRTPWVRSIWMPWLSTCAPDSKLLVTTYSIYDQSKLFKLSAPDSCTENGNADCNLPHRNVKLNEQVWNALSKELIWAQWMLSTVLTMMFVWEFI